MGVEGAPEGLSGSVGRWRPEGDFLGLTRVLSVWQRSDQHQGGWLPSTTSYKQWGSNPLSAHMEGVVFLQISPQGKSFPWS